MTTFVQATSTYFFKEEPKQIFVGADLCARWYLLLKGQPAPQSAELAERIAAYCQEAQDIFSWVLAGKGVTSFVGHIAEHKKWSAEATCSLSEAVSQAGACGDIVINKFFDSKAPKLKVLGYVADTMGDITDLALGVYDHKFLILAKAVTSLFITTISVATYRGAQHYILPVVSLTLETVLFIEKIALYYIEFHRKK